ncbi:MAG: DUF4445 domain-containing protein [Firmicutes bacterium]|nr:DUF4445 domain-containing protein [Bacillota bacterium]
MITVTIHQKDQISKVQAAQGELMLDILQREQIPVRTPCGGRGTCRKCRITMTQTNQVTGQMETVQHRACTTQVMEDCDVWVPDYSSGYKFRYEETARSAKEEVYQAAVDLGTTTIAVQVIDQEGIVALSGTKLNEQEICGADVISRIKASGEGKRELLTDLVRKEVAGMLKDYHCEKVAVCGNTTMLHLFLGVDPSPIGVYPFTPVFTETKVVAGSEVGLDADTVIVLPSASGYIGADTVCGALAQDLSKESGTLLIDLGTNGEMVLSFRGQMFAASTAAGPCLEGAEIECGMGGTPGAIAHVRLAPPMTGYLRPLMDDSPFQMKIIDAELAEGICGSGLIDIVALLLELGVMTKDGQFVKDQPPGPARTVAQRIRDGKLYLTDSVYLSEQDIRKFQLAKAAIRAGIETLLEAAGAKTDDVDEVLIAGGLGYFLRTESAVRAGLIPEEISEEMEAVGNAALEGALKCLDPEVLKEAEKIAKAIQVIDLSAFKGFEKRWIASMNF